MTRRYTNLRLPLGLPLHDLLASDRKVPCYKTGHFRATDEECMMLSQSSVTATQSDTTKCMSRTRDNVGLKVCG